MFVLNSTLSRVYFLMQCQRLHGDAMIYGPVAQVHYGAIKANVC